MKYEIVTLPAYRAVGLKWEGTFTEIVPYLKNTIQETEDRAIELNHKINPSIQLGLSYHVIEGGFIHYSVYEVNDDQTIPDGMIEIKIPEWTYVRTTHHKGEDITKTYIDLQQWLMASDYTSYRKTDVDYYDPYLPIKHEHYPVNRDRIDPHFDIYIPIMKK